MRRGLGRLPVPSVFSPTLCSLAAREEACGLPAVAIAQVSVSDCLWKGWGSARRLRVSSDCPETVHSFLVLREKGAVRSQPLLWVRARVRGHILNAHEAPSLGKLCTCSAEGKGNPLHCSCLENPMDRGAWWASVWGHKESDLTE